MQKQLKLDQSRLLGFKLQSTKPGEGVYAIGAKIGKVQGAVVMGTKIGFVKPNPKPSDAKPV